MVHETIPYCLSRHPAKVSPDTVFQRGEIKKGSNCQLYSAWVIRALGYYLPDYYRSSEIYFDPEGVLETISVKTPERWQNGDIIGFWQKEKNDNPMWIHVGTLLRQENSLKIVHNCREKAYAMQESLQDVLERYRGIAYIRRPKVMIPALWNPQALQELGFY